MKYLATLSLVLMVAFGAFAQEESAAELKNQGNEALRAKNYKGALELFEKAIASWGEEPMDEAMVYNAATCARKIKNYDKAINLYGESKKLNYKADVSTYYIASALKSSDKDAEMEKVLLAGIEEYGTSKYVAHMKKMLAGYYVKESNELYTKGQGILNTRVDGNRDEWDAIKEKAKVVLDEAADLAKKALEYDAANKNAQAILSGIDTFLAS
ncbi:tetratricopeptide repeat protein [Carboxylicivirga mesophila]|uniref:Tetratricopeptide repeat protein n=1 Tax=Carboxylicivirga mesophila TaxID=1166478 RepID=A0ABS5KAW4_9BACT|nr:tetratricopeptide repeat protein [Carboxylicivirga mesophila]MBS2212160.1 tetratricopeptide repeat protein [Carboxylicivirga mesophila]